MFAKILYVTLFSLLFCFTAHSAERSFRVSETKTLTPLVERFYGKDTIAFATMFCSPEAPQVMFVDSRIRELDGKTFKFSSLDSCDNGRLQARQLSKKCNVELVLDLDNQNASIRVSQCSGS